MTQHASHTISKAYGDLRRIGTRKLHDHNQVLLRWLEADCSNMGHPGAVAPNAVCHLAPKGVKTLTDGTFADVRQDPEGEN